VTLRFIIKQRTDNSYDAVASCLRTIDIEAPALEAILAGGGQGIGGPGYDIRELVGVEILPPKDPS
jgi:hypothetical protein